MPVMSSPQNSTAPPVGLICPSMLLNSVVLPEPLGPITPTISPGADRERDAVDGVDRAVRLPHVLDFEKGRHRVPPPDLKRSPSESSPPGR